MEDEKFQAELLRRLDVLISLQLEIGPQQTDVSITSKVQRLVDLGLSSGEIAPIVRRPVKFVSAIISKKKKRSRIKGAKSSG